jgi:hypothetical protein
MIDREKSCEDIQQEIPLYSYGEVSSEMEEKIESHLADCTACRAELERHRSFMSVMDGREDRLDSSLLVACRNDLRAHLVQPRQKQSFWNWQIRFSVPIGAMALVAMGFFAGRFLPETSEPLFSSVRSVEPDVKSGLINIAVDETRRHTVSGLAQDPRIETLLLNAIREEANPGIRVESIGILKNNADSEQVRLALIEALTHDPNAGVRLKALEGLKSYAGDAMVRRTLANVLLKDNNPGVRVQAIDLLTAHHDDSIVGVLQDAVRKEDNSYVRTHCGRLLEEMKASVGTY